MPYNTSTYRFSSATDHASCRTKKKRVSAQLSRLVGADSRRGGFSEDAGIGARSCNNNNISKAAAWMWHTRGIADAAVLPTKQRRVQLVNASYINSRSSRHEEAITRDEINTRKPLQPSRFKAEANMLRSAPAADQLHISSASAHQNYASHESKVSPDTLDQSKHEERPSTFLYDEFELSCLQELLEREIGKHSAQQHLVSHDINPYPCRSSSSKRSPSHEIKPFSSIQKLFKRLYTTLNMNSTRKNSAKDSGSSGLGPRKVGNVQHVIHHHHHHYHHYNRLLDLSAHESHKPAPTSDLHHGFVRRRRANSESCSEAHRSNNIIELNMVDDSLHADAHHRPARRFRAPVLHINSPAGDDDTHAQGLINNDLQVSASGGSKLASAEYYYRPHSIEIF